MIRMSSGNCRSPLSEVTLPAKQCVWKKLEEAEAENNNKNNFDDDDDDVN